MSKLQPNKSFSTSKLTNFRIRSQAVCIDLTLTQPISQSGRIDVINSDETDWIVPFVSVILGLFSSNLQLNEMKWGTMKF